MPPGHDQHLNLSFFFFLTGSLDIDRVAQELAGPDPRHVVTPSASGNVDVFVRAENLSRFCVDQAGALPGEGGYTGVIGRWFCFSVRSCSSRTHLNRGHEPWSQGHRAR